MNDIYLGDGLYASFDGWQLRLFTERENGTHEVFLEPEVIANLLNFLDTIKKQNARRL